MIAMGEAVVKENGLQPSPLDVVRESIASSILSDPP